jgi:hypothetical protein
VNLKDADQAEGSPQPQAEASVAAEPGNDRDQ